MESYECVQKQQDDIKQRDDIKPNCCPLWSLVFLFFSSTKWIFLYFLSDIGLALQHFLLDIHEKCLIVWQVWRILTALVSPQEELASSVAQLVHVFPDTDVAMKSFFVTENNELL